MEIALKIHVNHTGLRASRQEFTMQQKILRHLKNSLMLLCYWAILPTNSGRSAPSQLPLVFPDPNNSPINYDAEPLDVEMLKDAGLRKNTGVITADSIERFPIFRKTMPSLWWTQDQLPNKLVLNWLAYPHKKRIDLVVNPQFWNNLEYLERYQLINRYGLAARRYGYNVRIFNLKFSEAQPIVAYTCSSGLETSSCYIQWQEINQRSLKPSTGR
jgi:hypothetical protein